LEIDIVRRLLISALLVITGVVAYIQWAERRGVIEDSVGTGLPAGVEAGAAAINEKGAIPASALVPLGERAIGGSNAAPFGSDSWLESASDEDLAAYFLGFKLDQGSTVADHFAELERRGNEGDQKARLTAAELYGRCRHRRQDSDNPDVARTAVACSTLPPRDIDYVADAYETAAVAGFAEAILKQPTFRPSEVKRDPQSEESIAWARNVAGRLEVLAGMGNHDARFVLGSFYFSHESGIHDVEQARRYLSEYIASVGVDNPRRTIAIRMLKQLGG
jgi:hypothetical protein